MVSSLRLLNFRCFDSLSLEFSETGTVIVGANAQGKTSLLEAVCVLVRLQSPRNRRLGKMVKLNNDGSAKPRAEGFGLAGECWGIERQLRYSSGQGLSMKCEGEPVAKHNDYLSNGGLVVWMGNDDLDLVRGSAKVRRRYLDFLGCQLDPLYRDHLARYTRVLKSRNLLLKDRIVRDPEVAAYTELLLTHGHFITQARGELVKLLSPEVSASQAKVSGCDERVSIEYVSGSGDSFSDELEKSYERERRIGQTVVGPHRDELKLAINGMASADFASEGQQRTMALALKLAQGELLQKRAGKMPVYLLDDIFGELDPQRRNALMAALPGSAQKLITTTHIDWMKEEFPVIDIAKIKAAGG